MDHEQSAPLLADLALGRLARDQAVPAWTHVSTCIECQETLITMHRVRQSLADAVDSLAELHPDPEMIVRMALGPDEMAPADRERIEAHLGRCAACRKEVELARSADFDTGRTEQSKHTRFERLRPLLGAAVLAIVALAYPAFLGLTELPALRRAQRESAEELARLEARVPAPGHPQGSTPWSGGVSLLLLRGATRGDAAPAELHLRPGQPYQPVLIDYSLADLLRREPATSVRVSLTNGSDVVWSTQQPSGALWDAQQRVVSLLIPVSLMPPGTYRLELSSANNAEPLFSREFTVLPPGTGTATPPR